MGREGFEPSTLGLRVSRRPCQRVTARALNTMNKRVSGLLDRASHRPVVACDGPFVCKPFAVAPRSSS